MKEVENTSGDLIIAIGGGSVMDAAKFCCVLKDADYTIKDLLNDPMLAKKQIKTVMIPTTCGTGSEATCNAIVAVPEEQSKKGIVNDSMIPDYVVLDSNMIRKLPKSIVAATGVDALAHVVECFTSKKHRFPIPMQQPEPSLFSTISGKLITIRTIWKQKAI